MRRKIYGIDFSGAKDAGKRIWIAKARVGDSNLLIEDCYPAADLPDSGIQLEKCLASLRRFITENGDAVFALDFPFGLPATLISHHTWVDFVMNFPQSYKGPEHFRILCFSKAGYRELRRKTDIRNKAPFSPYNLRVYKQTYYGIRELILPLLIDDLACFIPMMEVRPEKAWVLEICPGSTLKSLGIYVPYKDTKSQYARTNARHSIVRRLVSSEHLKLAEESMLKLVITDPRGDVLDSIVACLAAYRALKKGICNLDCCRDDTIEGKILGAFNP